MLKLGVVLKDLLCLLNWIPVRVMDFFLDHFVDVFSFLEKSLFLESLTFAMLFRSTNTSLFSILLNFLSNIYNSGNKIILDLINVKPHVLPECFVRVLKEELHSFFEGLFIEVFPPCEICKLGVSHSVLIG
jgi:hypothetical protein